MMQRVLSFFCSLVFIAIFSSTVLAQARIGTGNIKKLYDQHCSACHGTDLAGGASVSLVDDQWTHKNTDASLATIIQQGIADKGMPAFSDALNSEQIRAMVVLIREYAQIRQQASAQPAASGSSAINSQHHAFILENIAQIDGTLWGLDFMPDGSFLVTEKGGVLWQVKPGAAKVFIKNMPKVWAQGQGGLLDVKLHPHYEKNGWIYISYAQASKANPANAMTAIARGKIKNNRWVENQVIHEFDDALDTSSPVHFGSRIVFADDGTLFFSVGDRGNMEAAQDITRPNGKVHRINADGTIPKDNPFVKAPGAIASIWSYGNRNPQGLAMHPATRMLWQTEHGPRGGDELNVIEKGHNYGWPKVTFGINYNGRPISALTHAEGITPPITHWTPSIAIAGMDFYRGSLFPAWQNDLFLGGLRAQALYRIKTDGKTIIEQELVLSNQGRIRDVINGPKGHIYLLLNNRSSSKGHVVRLAPAPSMPATKAVTAITPDA